MLWNTRDREDPILEEEGKGLMGRSLLHPNAARSDDISAAAGPSSGGPGHGRPQPLREPAVAIPQMVSTPPLEERATLATEAEVGLNVVSQVHDHDASCNPSAEPSMLTVPEAQSLTVPEAQPLTVPEAQPPTLPLMDSRVLESSELYKAAVKALLDLRQAPCNNGETPPSPRMTPPAPRPLELARISVNRPSPTLKYLLASRHVNGSSPHKQRTLLPGSRWAMVQQAMKQGRLSQLTADGQYSAVSCSITS